MASLRSMALKINTPEKLLKWMDFIKYGWMDRSHKKYYTFDEWWYKLYIASPEDVYRYKIGTCYEQTFFEKYFFDKYKIENKMIHVQQYYVSNHSFLIYKVDKGWMYFEHSFQKFKGIYGPFSNIQQIIKLVYNNMEKFEKGNKGYKAVIMDPKKVRPHMTAQQFYKGIKYDFNRSN